MSKWQGDGKDNSIKLFVIPFIDNLVDVKVNHDIPEYYPSKRAIRINLICMDDNDPKWMFHHHNFEIVVLSKNCYDSQLLYYYHFHS